MQTIAQGLSIRKMGHSSEIPSDEFRPFREGSEGARRLRWMFYFVDQWAMLFRMRGHFCSPPEAPALAQVRFSEITARPPRWVRGNGGGNWNEYMEVDGVCR